jgi:hypothetical protein
MVSRQSRGKPHVVIHLDAKRGLEGVDFWGMRVIEVFEIGGVQRCTGKKSRRKRRESLGGVLE